MRPGVQKLWSRLIVASLVLVLVSACGAADAGSGGPGTDEASALRPVALEPGAKLRVVATTNIIGDVVHNVGGDRIELTTLMGIGVDPHTYVARPSDAAAIHDAHIVFVNGADLETNLEEMLNAAGGEGVHVSLSDGLELRAAAEGAKKGHGDVDPHVWFNVQNVMTWVQTIANTLSALDPDNATSYGENAQNYLQELEELDNWVMEQIALIPESHCKLVTNHPAFGYLADRYGLKQLGAVYPVNPSSEPSAQDVAALQDTIRQYGVPAVFTESTVNPKLAEQVAQDAGIKLVPLYTGSLGPPGSGAETYIGLIRYDVSAIVEALR